MSRYIIILFFIIKLCTISVLAQNWGTPVNVSNMGRHCNVPRMITDHNGVIHAVWSYMITQTYRPILYSKSVDQGDSWSTPIMIANDSLQWFDSPDITCDQQNHLYVSYEGDDMAPGSTLIYMVIYNGISWSSPFIISENLYGSNNSLTLTDHSGRIYCFWHEWYNNEVKLMYKYNQDDVWSQVIIPYTQQGEFFWIRKIIADSADNLHCVGTHHYADENRYDDRVIYCYYYKETDQWATVENISDTTNCSWQGSSIDLDQEVVPHFVWGQFIKKYPSIESATLYRYPTASGWLPVDSIETNLGSHDHQLVIGQNNLSNVIVNQWYHEPSHLSYLVHYRKINEIWERKIIDTITGVFYDPQAKMINSNDIGVVYFKGSYATPYGDIYFSKYNINTEIQSHQTLENELSASPNPFVDKTVISYSLSHKSHVLLDLYNFQGQLIKRFVNETQFAGNYNVNWQIPNSENLHLVAGIYYLRLQTNVDTYSRILIKL